MDPQKARDPIQVAPELVEATKPADRTVAKTIGNTKAGVDAREQEGFRDEITGQVMAMTRFLLTNDRTDPIGEAGTAVLGALDRGEHPVLEDLIAAHHELKLLVAPATPGALVARTSRMNQRSIGRFLGPNKVVRHLALSNLFFMIAFLGISLSPVINDNTLQLSIYEQSGYPLLLKLCFLVAAAGLGASFGALFDVWDEIKTNRYDPADESVHWMKIGLGIVAGIALTEIFQTPTPNSDGANSSAALIALVGGFSAGLLHVALSRLVTAVKSIFAPPEKP